MSTNEKCPDPCPGCLRPGSRPLVAWGRLRAIAEDGGNASQNDVECMAFELLTLRGISSSGDDTPRREAAQPVGDVNDAARAVVERWEAENGQSETIGPLARTRLIQAIAVRLWGLRPATVADLRRAEAPMRRDAFALDASASADDYARERRRESPQAPKNYALRCSVCGVLSSICTDEGDVVDAATDAGWEVEGNNEDEQDRCPSCREQQRDSAGAETPDGGAETPTSNPLADRAAGTSATTSAPNAGQAYPHVTIESKLAEAVRDLISLVECDTENEPGTDLYKAIRFAERVLAEHDAAALRPCEVERCPFSDKHDEHEDFCARRVEKPGEGPFGCTCSTKAALSSGVPSEDQQRVARTLRGRAAHFYWKAPTAYQHEWIETGSTANGEIDENVQALFVLLADTWDLARSEKMP